VAVVVTRRPVLTAVPALVVLGVLAAPLGSVAFGLPDDRAVPAQASQARQVGDVLRADFALHRADAVMVALPRTPASQAAGYAATLSRLPHVSQVDAASGRFVAGRPVGPGDPTLGHGDGSALRVVPDVEVYSPAAQDLVAAVRAAPAPGTRLVGGPTARFVDVNAAIASRLPLVAALMLLTTFVLIFAFTGSVVLPLKALVVTAAGLGAVVGAMAWIFQQGHGAGLLGFTPTPLSVSIPPLMFCLAFGLSMDYEVFLLGRIAEFHRAGLSTNRAVVEGQARTGRIVSAAAALMSVTFLAFATSQVSFIKMLGIGSALAVLLDATLIRGVLVPAMMQVMGRANWWAPAALGRLHRRLALPEHDLRLAAPSEPPPGRPVVVTGGRR
jgi:RND superfamily putative drug exporter